MRARIAVGVFVLLAGFGVQAEVIDSHFHFSSPGGHSGAGVGATEALTMAAEAGIDRVVALSAGYYKDSEAAARAENDFVKAEADRSGGRVIPFCGVHTAQDWAVREIERCGKDLGLRGLKIHLTSNRQSLLDPAVRARVDAIFKAAGAQKMPVIVDYNKWDTNEWMQLVFLALGNLKTKVIIPHALLLNYRDLGWLAAIYQEEPGIPRNIFLDISGTVIFFAGSPEQDQFVWYLRQFGTERIFFGSDAPIFSPKETRAAFDLYPFSKEERAGILGGNFARWFLVQETQKP